MEAKGDVSDNSREDSEGVAGQEASADRNGSVVAEVKSSSSSPLLSAAGAVLRRFAASWTACAAVYLLGNLRCPPLLALPAVLAALLLLAVARRGRTRAAAARAAPAEGALLTDAAFAELPAWVVDPAARRAEWVNKLVRQLWPFLGEWVQKSLSALEADEQRLETLRLRELRFDHTTLGRISPRVTGVKVHQWSGAREIVVDLNLRFDSDAVLAVRATPSLPFLPDRLTPSFDFTLTNFSFRGALRLHLRPLLPHIPFAGCAFLSLLAPPDVDFDLGGSLACLFHLPGFHFLLRRVLGEQLAAHVVLPHSVAVPLAPAADRAPLRNGLSPGEHPRAPASASSYSSSLYAPAPPSGVLSVHIVEAKNLVNKDSKLLAQGKSDPYVKLTIVADGASHTFRSEVVEDCLDPVWRLLIDLPVDDPASLEDLAVEVWDRDVASADDFLGRCSVAATVAATARASGQTQEVWKRLDGVERGAIKLEVSWATLQVDRASAKMLGDDGYHQGVLTVLVDSCAHLLGGRTGLRAPNASARLELCGIAQVTEPVAASSAPVFAHRMTFLVRDPAADTLKVAVVDERTGDELGSLRADLSDLLARPALTRHTCPFSLRQPRRREGSYRHDGGKQPCIFMSLVFRYLKRPKTTSFGVHRGLQELNQIMQATAAVGSESPAPKPVQQQQDVESKAQPVESDAVATDEMDTSEDRAIASHLASAALCPLMMNGSNKRQSGENGESVASPTHLKADGAPKDGDATTSTSPPAPPVRFDRRPRVLLTLRYAAYRSHLSVVVHRAKNLQETPHTTLRPSPYVKLYAIESAVPGGGVSRRLDDSKRRTRVQKNKVNPVFEETLNYSLPPSLLRRRRLELSVCSDRGLLGRNVVLGRCIVGLDCLRAVEPGQDLTRWFALAPSEQDHQQQQLMKKSGTFDAGGGSAKLPRKAAQPKQSRSAVSLR